MTVVVRRHVLFLIPSLFAGGSERVLLTLLRHIDRDAFRLTLAVVDLRNAAFLHELAGDVELVDLKSTRVRYALPKIIRLIWKQRPQVVFSTLGHLNLALAVIRPLLPGATRFVARESCFVSELIRHDVLPQVWRWAYRRFYRRFDVVVCQSTAMRDDLVENYLLPVAQTVVVDNPVDVAYLRRMAALPVATGFEKAKAQQGTDPIHLLAVGRLVEQKGFDILIEALARCQNPCFRLTLIGEGVLRDELEAQARRQGVAAQLRFVGLQRNPYPFFAQADVYVLSSRFEGFPNTVLEALACGTPVIATPALGGIRDFLRGVEGCEVADSVSSEALATAICRWATRAERRLKVPAAIVQHELHRVVPQYEAILRS